MRERCPSVTWSPTSAHAKRPQPERTKWLRALTEGESCRRSGDVPIPLRAVPFETCLSPYATAKAVARSLAARSDGVLERLGPHHAYHRGLPSSVMPNKDGHYSDDELRRAMHRCEKCGGPTTVTNRTDVGNGFWKVSGYHCHGECPKAWPAPG
jgi:hypothetical protein